MFKNKIDIRSIILIVITASILGFGYNFISPDGIHLIYEETTYNNYQGSAANNTSSPLLITLQQALDFYDQGIVFLDARDRWDFADGRIKDAVSLPEYSFSKDSDVLKSLKKNDKYVIYCGGDDCDTSKRLAKYLSEIGFNNLFIYTGGYTQWKELGMPIETDE